MLAAVQAGVNALRRSAADANADADAEEAAASLVAVAVLEELERAAGRGPLAEAEAVASVPRAFAAAGGEPGGGGGGENGGVPPPPQQAAAAALLDALFLDLLWPLASHALSAVAGLASSGGADDAPQGQDAAAPPAAAAAAALAAVGEVAARCALLGGRPREAFVAIAEAVSRLTTSAALEDDEENDNDHERRARAQLAAELACVLPPLLARVPQAGRRAASAPDACAALAEAARLQQLPRKQQKKQQPKAGDHLFAWPSTFARAAQQMAELLPPSPPMQQQHLDEKDARVHKARRRVALLCLQLLSLMPVEDGASEDATTATSSSAAEPSAPRAVSTALATALQPFAAGGSAWAALADLVARPSAQDEEEEEQESDEEDEEDDGDGNGRRHHPLLPPGSLLGAARALLLSIRHHDADPGARWPFPPPSTSTTSTILDPVCRVAAALFRDALASGAAAAGGAPASPAPAAAVEGKLDASLALMQASSELAERLWRLGDGSSSVSISNNLLDAASLAALAAAQAPARATRDRAAAALRALLSGVPPVAARAAALRALLVSQPPEVCALMLQRARLELLAELDDGGAGGAGGGGNGGSGGSSSSAPTTFLALAPRWALEWALPEGPHGWHPPAVPRLVAHANACCAALNLLRLLLLRPGAWGAAAAAAAQGAGGDDDGQPRQQKIASLLRDRKRLASEALRPLAAAVRAAAAELEEERRGERARAQAAAGEGAEAAAAMAAAATAAGVGGATDALLALDRVQVVLEHVLDLLLPGG
jgi:hypothetical protein